MPLNKIRYNSRSVSIVSFLFVFASFATPYALAGNTLDTFILLICIVIPLFSGLKIRVEKSFMPFLLYAYIVPLLVSLAMQADCDMRQNIVQMALILYTGFLFITFPFLKLEKVLLFYKILVYIAVTIFFIQEYSYNSLGYRPTFYLPFLDSYIEGVNMKSFIVNRSLLSRSSSFFAEPAHFAQFILPYFCIVVNNTIENKKLNWEIFVLLVVFYLIGSGTGYLGVVAVGIAALFITKMSIQKRVVLTTIVLIIGVYVINHYAGSDFFMQIDRRMEEFDAEDRSGFMRFTRGFLIYDDLPFIFKIFGLAPGCIADFVDHSRYAYLFYNEYYFNVVQRLLIGVGYIGTFFFLKYLFPLLTSKSNTSRLIIVCMLSLCFMEAFFLTTKMMLFIGIASLFNDKSKEAHLE